MKRCSREAACILLVDDEPLVRGAVASMIARFGHRLVGVASGSEALHALAESRFRFDLILTDHEMPGGPNGIEVAREARLGGFAGPIILTSGSLPPDASDQMTSAGVTDFLQKPYSLSTLRRALDAALEKSGE